MSSTTKRKVFTCPKCGVPNIVGDRRCMYCETRFTGVGVFFSLLITKIKKNSLTGLFKFKGGTGAVPIVKKIAGVCLLLLGLLLFARALMKGEFRDWIIAVILLGYGGVLIK